MTSNKFEEIEVQMPTVCKGCKHLTKDASNYDGACYGCLVCGFISNGQYKPSHWEPRRKGLYI